VLIMFLAFIILALYSRRRPVTIAITAISSAALCYFTWLFAAGLWAF
jgi:hypothetical protein